MKKVLLFILTGLVSLSLVGCGNSVKNVEGEVSDLMTKLYTEEMNANLPSLQQTVVDASNKDMVKYLIGTSDYAFDSAVVSEPLIGSVAHSVALIRVSEGTDIEAFKKAIEENIDPRKWICVTAEKVIVDNIGDLIILIMANEADAKTLHDNFKGLGK